MGETGRKAGRADDHYINVTQGVLFITSHRSVNECTTDSITKLGESILQRVCYPECFRENATEFGEDWQFILGLKVGAFAVTSLAQDAA